MFDKLIEIVKSELNTSSHDFAHTLRVYNNCIKIAETEFADTANMDILRAAAILHDIARPKENVALGDKGDHAILGARQAKEILLNLGVSEDFADKVSEAIKTHRFRSGMEPKSLEAKILFDADKIDTLGNIGIARAYMFAGEHNMCMYCDCDINDYIKTNLSGGVSSGKIKDMKKHAPNLEFMIKSLNVPDRMFTQTGKEIATQRAKRMQQFFDDMQQEISGLK